MSDCKNIGEWSETYVKFFLAKYWMINDHYGNECEIDYFEIKDSIDNKWRRYKKVDENNNIFASDSVDIDGNIYHVPELNQVINDIVDAFKNKESRSFEIPSAMRLLNKLGTNKVKSDETTIPPITVIAKGDQRLEDSLLSNAINVILAIVVKEVMTIGLSRS